MTYLQLLKQESIKALFTGSLLLVVNGLMRYFDLLGAQPITLGQLTGFVVIFAFLSATVAYYKQKR